MEISWSLQNEEAAAAKQAVAQPTVSEQEVSTAEQQTASTGFRTAEQQEIEDQR